MTTYEEFAQQQYNQAADKNILFVEALQKIDSLSDYDETNEWVDPHGLLEDIAYICSDLKKKGYI